MTSQIVKKYFISSERTEYAPPFKGQAAVLIALKEMPDGLHVLLVLRSKHLNRHAGEVAFPGGMWEVGDIFPQGTALREANEEVGIACADVLGELSVHYTRNGTRVVPVVAIVDSNQRLQVDDSEIEEAFWVPLRFFSEDQRLRTDIFFRKAKGLVQQVWVPAYRYQQYEIWGFTAAVIKCFINLVFDANIARENCAPEKVWPLLRD